MHRLITRWILSSVSIAIVSWLVPGIRVGSGTSAVATVVVTAAILGLVNAIVKPVLTLLSCPLVLLTLGTTGALGVYAPVQPYLGAVGGRKRPCPSTLQEFSLAAQPEPIDGAAVRPDRYGSTGSTRSTMPSAVFPAEACSVTR